MMLPTRVDSRQQMVCYGRGLWKGAGLKLRCWQATDNKSVPVWCVLHQFVWKLCAFLLQATSTATPPFYQLARAVDLCICCEDFLELLFVSIL